MLGMILRRILVAIPMMLLVIVVSFVLMYAAPGSPFRDDRNISPGVIANMEAKYGLDQPVWTQVWVYVRGIATEFDFGPSFQYPDLTVNEIMGYGFPVTLTYGSIAFVIATVLGIGLGVAAALRQNGWIDYLANGLAVSADALPNFVMAPLLVLVFTYHLGWLPGGGWNGGAWPYLVMPIIAMSTSYVATVVRLMRTALLESLRARHVRTARAMGMPEHVVIWRHALRPAMIPVVTSLSAAFVSMITGSVVIDLYFSTGGIGGYYVESAANRDYGVIMGITLLYGGLTILFNLLADISYAWLDPRIGR